MPSTIAFSMVCHRWRNIVLSAPELWSVLHIVVLWFSKTSIWTPPVVKLPDGRDSPYHPMRKITQFQCRRQIISWMKLCIERSQDLPFSCKLYFQSMPTSKSYPDRISLSQLTDTLASCGPRWQDIEIQLAPDEFSKELLHSVRTVRNFPHLCSFWTDVDCCREKIYSKAPNIRCAQISTGRWDWDWERKINWHGLENLHFLNLGSNLSDYTRVRSVLDKCTALRELAFEETRSDFGYSANIPRMTDPIVLPYLTCLQLTIKNKENSFICHILPFLTLDLPSLREVDLSVSSSLRRQRGPGYENLVLFLRRISVPSTGQPETRSLKFILRRTRPRDSPKEYVELLDAVMYLPFRTLDYIHTSGNPRSWRTIHHQIKKISPALIDPMFVTVGAETTTTATLHNTAIDFLDDGGSDIDSRPVLNYNSKSYRLTLNINLPDKDLWSILNQIIIRYQWVQFQSLYETQCLADHYSISKQCEVRLYIPENATYWDRSIHEFMVVDLYKWKLKDLILNEQGFEVKLRVITGEREILPMGYE